MSSDIKASLDGILTDDVSLDQGIRLTNLLNELKRFREREPLVQKLLEDLLDVEWAHAPSHQIEGTAQAVRDFKLTE